MKVDKSVCTTELLPLEAAALDSAAPPLSTPPPPTITSSSTPAATAACFSTADRYGVVFTTLLENKMLAIKQQAATTTSSVDKRKPRDSSKGGAKSKRRGLAKTLTLCVRRNSLPSGGGERHATPRPPEDSTTTVVDIELGHIKGNAAGVDESETVGGGGGGGTDIDDDTELPPDGAVSTSSFDVPPDDCRETQITTMMMMMSTSNDETSNKDCQTSPPASASPPSQPPPPPPPASSLSDQFTAGSIHSGDSSTAPQPSRPAPPATCVQNIARSDGDASSGQTSSDARVRIAHSLPAIVGEQQHHHHHNITVDADLLLSPAAATTRARTLSNARRHHQRVLEARSISAQASPVLPRTHSGSGSTVRSPPAATVSSHHPFAASVTITENLIAEPPRHQTEPLPDASASTYRFAETLAQSLVAVKSRERAAAAARSDARLLGASMDSDSGSHGFINNFNELTAHSLSSVVCVNRPVITTTNTTMERSEERQQRFRAGWPSRPSSFDHRPTDRWSPDGGGGENGGRSSYRNQRHHARRSRMLMDGEESDRSDEKRNRRKYRHRGSDPVLIYPSSTGLPQCLLSMPPNRSIQIKYDDNTLYDVSLELDRKQAKKDVAARKSGHGRHHHHHHHHRHHHHHGNTHRHHMDDPDASSRRHARRHKKRILVHDLDTQKVKVIDPDDLPQRARWTIIATACLLLIMCLLLVGVTLRMAPLIDDMVRQENERLQQESLNRSRFVRNLTDAAAAVSADPYPLGP